MNWQKLGAFIDDSLTTTTTTWSSQKISEEVEAGGSGLPTGGTTGQVLGKTSNTNYDVNWVDPASGGGGIADYANLAAVIADTALTAGVRVKTLGRDAANDGGGARYRIADTNESKAWAITLTNGKFALIDQPDYVTYKMFGAPLDGVADDGPAMRLAHAYADSIYHFDATGQLPQYTCRVENHQGIIYKKDADAISFNSDIDLSGSTLLVDDTNAAWFGIYVWGNTDSLYWSFETTDTQKSTFTADNNVIDPKGVDSLPAGTVLKIEETPYTARDDSGYLYTVARRELIIHDMDGICSSPFVDDWTQAGGEEINCQISDLVNGGYKTNQMYTAYSASYTYIHKRHGTFIGCDVKLNMSASKYCSVMWCKRHNATVKNFTFTPQADKLHNTAFKNAMIYLWDCYNVKVSGLQGFNASGKKEGTSKGTSGYILRITNCSDVHVEDCRMQGYWGATAMDSVKNIHFDRCHMNRLDIHDYFSNLYANQCTFYNSSIQIGYGRGVASFTDCTFNWHPIVGESYASSHMVEFNLSYGRLFEGMVYIDNCRVFTYSPPDDEFNMFKMEFSPDATSITKHFRFPEIICKNVYVYSSDPTTHYSYFKITGTRRGTTSSIRPSHVYNVSGDNTVRWQYYGRGVDWGQDDTAIALDGILRVTDSFLDSEDPPKTQFYNYRYYVCTQAGALSFSGSKPTTTSSTEFTCGTAKLKYVGPDILWKSKHSYAVGDLCAAATSNWFPLYLFKCIKAGTSNGYFPTHTSGTVIDGINDAVSEQDACWWTYVATKTSWCTGWTANMAVTNGQRLLVEDRIYEVVQSGTLTAYPPYDTAWSGVTSNGTARVKFIGAKWEVKKWFPLNAYCEARGNIYRLANHDGITSGVLPVKGNLYCVDGDITWQHVSGTNTDVGNTAGDTWQANTAYAKDATVVSNGNTYKCAFDGKMTLPNKTIFENITTNMTSGQIFWFYPGTDVPTIQGDRAWNIIAENCEAVSTAPKGITGDTPYFCHAGNPNPIVTTGSGGGTGTGDMTKVVYDTDNDGIVDSAERLSTARTISITGDATGSASFDGSANAPISVTLAGSGVTAGSYTNSNITVDAKGRVTSVTNGTVSGADGKSAYQVWLDAGNTGTEAVFLASLKGATGDTGASGIVWKDTWNSSATYAVNDGVTYNGSSYRALVANTNVIPGTSTATTWAVIAAKGTDGTGSGDMTKAVYDTDDDGKVNSAALADVAAGVSYIDVTTTAPANGNTLLYDSASSKFKPGAVSSGGGVDITTVIASLPAYYQRDVKWQQGSAKTTLLSPARLAVNINNSGYILTSATEIALSTAANWDSTTTDYTLPANRAGKDFYIYACQPVSGSVPVIKLSVNSTVPDTYTTSNSRKIGGFHCLCVAVGTISGHTLTGYVAGDILPASIWDLQHRPVSSPEGMVYSEKANIWVDIYLPSGTGSSTLSVFGGTVADSRNWMDFVDDLAAARKRLLYDSEFQIVAAGSNEQTSIHGGSDPVTTGGHIDTASRRMVSNIGCEDCCGVQWQFLQDQSYFFGGAAAHTHAVTVTGEAETATTGAPSKDVAPTWSDKWIPGNKGRLYAQGTLGDVKVVAGGKWGNGTNCGSRNRDLSHDRTMAIADISARGCSSPV